MLKYKIRSSESTGHSPERCNSCLQNDQAKGIATSHWQCGVCDGGSRMVHLMVHTMHRRKYNGPRILRFPNDSSGVNSGQSFIHTSAVDFGKGIVMSGNVYMTDGSTSLGLDGNLVLGQDLSWSSTTSMDRTIQPHHLLVWHSSSWFSLHRRKSCPYSACSLLRQIIKCRLTGFE